MIINKSRIRDIILEQLLVIIGGEELDDEIEPPDFTDAWHPREISPRDDAWSGGDNLVHGLDHAFIQTGGSSWGPHANIQEAIKLILEEEASDGTLVVKDDDATAGLLEPVDDVPEEVEREDIVIRIKKKDLR